LGAVTQRVLVVQHEPDDPIHLMGEWMPGVDLDVCLAYDGHSVPHDLAEHDGLVVMGGAMGANDDDKAPWLRATRDLIRRAAETSVPTLGICLGHQLCAVALGGEVLPNPRGKQFGMLEVGWSADAVDDRLFGAVLGPRRALHWNDDVVTRLPDGARRLASATTGEVQAARYADTLWGVQWHPEVDAEIVRAWATDGSVSRDQVDPVLDDLTRSRRELDEAWRPLAVRFAAIVEESAG
jgi:GMP synthase (glutamine-hydrolysing)